MFELRDVTAATSVMPATRTSRLTSYTFLAMKAQSRIESNLNELK
jgi:hypothetical protein